LLGVFEVLEVPEVMRCVLLCMTEAVGVGLCLLEVFEVPQGGDALRATLYAGGYGG